MAEGMVKYTSRDGQEITLGFEIIRTYLVSGKKELVTPQELMFFMGLCKSRGLNPFKKDAYLIKYDNSPAAIVTSIDFYRSRARAQKDCRGWKKGIIVKNKEGIEERQGTLLLEGEDLLGGWFEAKPDGWEFPLHHTVNLRGYIKKKTDGTVTRFWEKDNQPSQIMKVAEAQGLRMACPVEFQQLYSDEEITAPTPDTDAGMSAAAEAERNAQEEAIALFKDQMKPFTSKELDEFLLVTAKANRVEIDTLMAEAGKDAETIKGFSASFEKWLGAQKQPTQTTPSPQQDPQAGVETAGNSPAPPNQISDPVTLSPIDKVKKLKTDDPKTYDYISRSLQVDGMASEALALLFLKEVEALKNQGEDPGPKDPPTGQGKMGFNSKKHRYEAQK